MSHSGILTFSLAMLTQDSVDTNTSTLQVTELLHGKLTPTTLTPFLPLVPRLLQSAILGSRSLWESAAGEFCWRSRGMVETIEFDLGDEDENANGSERQG